MWTLLGLLLFSSESRFSLAIGCFSSNSSVETCSTDRWCFTLRTTEEQVLRGCAEDAQLLSAEAKSRCEEYWLSEKRGRQRFSVAEGLLFCCQKSRCNRKFGESSLRFNANSRLVQVIPKVLEVPADSPAENGTQQMANVASSTLASTSEYKTSTRATTETTQGPTTTMTPTDGSIKCPFKEDFNDTLPCELSTSGEPSSLSPTRGESTTEFPSTRQPSTTEIGSPEHRNGTNVSFIGSSGLENGTMSLQSLVEKEERSKTTTVSPETATKGATSMRFGILIDFLIISPYILMITL